MAKGRKVRSTEAAGLLLEWSLSREPMSSWCGTRGLCWRSLSAFKGWGAERSAVEMGFAEVVPEPGAVDGGFVEIVREPESVAAIPCAHRARYRVELGKMTVEVDDDFRPETLQRLLRAVATC
mgnify:CR=1 FL=1